MKQFCKNNKWIFIFLPLIILIPMCLNIFFINGNLNTGKNLGNVEWLAFWGSYLGGAATLIAVCLTLSQNMKVIKQNEERSRIARMPYIEVMPFLDDDIHTTRLQPPNGFIIFTNNNVDKFRYDFPEKYRQIIESGQTKEPVFNTLRNSNHSFIRLILTQKAPSLARNIQLSVEQEETRRCLNPPFVLAAMESVKLPIFFDHDCPEGEYKFIVSFEDIEGRSYEQFFTIKHNGGNKYIISPINKPELQINKNF